MKHSIRVSAKSWRQKGEQMEYRLGSGTMHYSGKHYADIYIGSFWFCSFEFGKDLMLAIDFVRKLNGELRRIKNQNTPYFCCGMLPAQGHTELCRSINDDDRPSRRELAGAGLRDSNGRSVEAE